MFKVKVKTKTNLSKLEKLNQNLNELGKNQNVSISELLTVDFISKNTNFSNADDFFKACNIATADDFKNISDYELNGFIAKYTKFNSWNEMLNASAVEYSKKKLGL